MEELLVPVWVLVINKVKGYPVDALEKCFTTADINAFVTLHYAQWSPLQFACSRGNAEVVAWLLLHGADPNLGDHRGWQSIHLAATCCSSLACVKLLLDAGADIRLRNQRGFSALALAIQACNRSTVELLLYRGAPLENTNGVLIPKWVRQLAEGRERCRKAALLIVALRRLRRSEALDIVCLNVTKLIARNVWSTRLNEQWGESDDLKK